MNPLRRLTNNFTMYSVVGGSLGLLWLAALIGGLTGYVAVAPLSLLSSTLTILLTALGIGALGAWLVGTKQHLQSSIISGLIASFVYTPREGSEGLLIALTVGISIAASKYLFAWRGRHIFNPVAAAMAVTSVTGIALPSWWVATPVLFPFILLGGLVVLAKTRKLGMASVYLAIAIIGTVIQQLGYGESLVLSLQSAVLSWPLLFFAGFMLSEPLTMPPRRREQHIFAAMVACLSFITTLPIALLSMNFLAFLLGQRQGIRLAFLGKRLLSDTVYEYRFKPQRPLRFQAGQYIELSLPSLFSDVRGDRRMFSLVSAPTDTEVHIAFRLPEVHSAFKEQMRLLTSGQQVFATLVAGDFTLPKDHNQPLLLIASGIGITPFISQLSSMSAAQKERTTLVYCVRAEQDAAYVDWLRQQPIKLHIHTDQTLPALAAYQQHQAYVSGPPQFVDHAKHQLKAAGIRHIHTDHFSGY